ncbi:MAG: hypothetical protein ABJG78_04455 [Cyclobacteriaceae bacterium]
MRHAFILCVLLIFSSCEPEEESLEEIPVRSVDVDFLWMEKENAASFFESVEATVETVPEIIAADNYINSFKRFRELALQGQIFTTNKLDLVDLDEFSSSASPFHNISILSMVEPMRGDFFPYGNFYWDAAQTEFIGTEEGDQEVYLYYPSSDETPDDNEMVFHLYDLFHEDASRIRFGNEIRLLGEYGSGRPWIETINTTYWDKVDESFALSEISFNLKTANGLELETLWRNSEDFPMDGYSNNTRALVEDEFGNEIYKQFVQMRIGNTHDSDLFGGEIELGDYYDDNVFTTYFEYIPSLDSLYGQIIRRDNSQNEMRIGYFTSSADQSLLHFEDSTSSTFEILDRISTSIRSVVK